MRIIVVVLAAIIAVCLAAPKAVYDDSYDEEEDIDTKLIEENDELRSGGRSLDNDGLEDLGDVQGDSSKGLSPGALQTTALGRLSTLGGDSLAMATTGSLGAMGGAMSSLGAGAWQTLVIQLVTQIVISLLQYFFPTIPGLASLGSFASAFSGIAGAMGSATGAMGSAMGAMDSAMGSATGVISSATGAMGPTSEVMSSAAGLMGPTSGVMASTTGIMSSPTGVMGGVTKAFGGANIGTAFSGVQSMF